MSEIAAMLRDGPNFHHIQLLMRLFGTGSLQGETPETSNSVAKQLGFAGFDWNAVEGWVLKAMGSPRTSALQKVLIRAECERLLADGESPAHRPTALSRRATGRKALLDRVRHLSEPPIDDPALTMIAQVLGTNSESGLYVTESEFARVVTAAEEAPVVGREHMRDFSDYVAQYRVDPYRSPTAVVRDTMRSAERTGAAIINESGLLANVPQAGQPRRQPGETYGAGISQDPWHLLEGVCGHAALAMIALARNQDLAKVRSGGERGVRELVEPSLTWAQGNGLTVTGEIFDLANLVRIARHFHGIDGVVHHGFFSETPRTFQESYDLGAPHRSREFRAAKLALIQALNRRNPTVIAFDVDHRGYPMRANGMRSHFGVIVHHFDQDEETFFIMRHGWGFLRLAAGTTPADGTTGPLDGYFVVSEHELITSMLGVIADTYYRPLTGKLVTGEPIPLHQHLPPSSTRLFGPVHKDDVNAGADQSRVRGIVEFELNASPEGGVPFSAFELPGLTTAISYPPGSEGGR